MRHRGGPCSRLAIAAAILCASLAAGCHKPPVLSREAIRSLIESSAAFKEPSGVVFIDTTFRPGPNTRRQIVGFQGIEVKQDGPFGIAGQTATVNFTYRWTEGPLSGVVLRSKARMNSSGGDWKVYEDYLRDQLTKSEGGAEE